MCRLSVAASPDAPREMMQRTTVLMRKGGDRCPIYNGSVAEDAEILVTLWLQNAEMSGASGVKRMEFPGLL